MDLTLHDTPSVHAPGSAFAFVSVQNGWHHLWFASLSSMQTNPLLDYEWICREHQMKLWNGMYAER
eukprot:3714547-Amphidinium_carterae.1